MADFETRTHSGSIDIAAAPDAVYDLVSDVTRTGEWSPICKECWWDDPARAGQLGAVFTGRNEVPGRTWETRCEVVAADRGDRFAWEVNGGLVAWGYRMEAAGSGTRLTETWEFRPAGQQFFHDKYAADAPHEIDARTTAAHEGIPATLAAIKTIAERG